MQTDDLVTTKEVARRLHVSVTTVRNYARAGLIPCEVTFGGHRRFDLSHVLEAWQKATGATVAEVDEETALQPLEVSEGWKNDWAITAIRTDDADHDHDDVLQPEPFPGVRGKTRFVVSRRLVEV